MWHETNAHNIDNLYKLLVLIIIIQIITIKRESFLTMFYTARCKLLVKVSCYTNKFVMSNYH